MKLYAISDLHLNYEENRQALLELPSYQDDWLIVAGDVGDSFEHFELAWQQLAPRFAQLLWVPGNHDLWTLDDLPETPRGEARYRELVEICRRYNVLTPEDPYVVWPGAGPPHVLAPLFLLYDYSFRPDDVPAGKELVWALRHDVFCLDERFLASDPYRTKQDWCAARCELTERRLDEIPAEYKTVLINHFPLLREHARLPAIPRFAIWCGTRRTEDWHRRYRASAVVYGHLHIRKSRRLDGVRFEEVSLGYPRHWRPRRGMAHYLRQILPEETGRAFFGRAY